MPIDGPRAVIRTPGVYAGIEVNFVRTLDFLTGEQCGIATGGVGGPWPRSPEREPGGGVGGKTGGNIGSDSLCFNDVCEHVVNSGDLGGPLFSDEVNASSSNIKTTISWCASYMQECSVVSNEHSRKVRPSDGVDLLSTGTSILDAAFRGSV